MKLIDHSRVVHSLCQLLCAVSSQLITPDDSVGLHQVKVREVGCLGVSMPPELSRSVRLERQNPLCYYTQSLGTSSGGRLFVQIPFVLLCLMRPESIFMMSRYLQEKGTGTHGDVHPRLDLRVGYEFWRFGQRLNFYSEWLVLRIRKWLNAYGAFNSYGALLLATYIIVWLLSHPDLHPQSARDLEWLSVSTSCCWGSLTGSVLGFAFTDLCKQNVCNSKVKLLGEASALDSHVVHLAENQVVLNQGGGLGLRALA